MYVISPTLCGVYPSDGLSTACTLNTQLSQYACLTKLSKLQLKCHCRIYYKKRKPSGATISLIIRLHASYPAPLVTFMEGLSLQNRATLGIDNN